MVFKLFIFLTAFSIGSSAFAASVSAKRDKTKVFAEPSRKGEVLGELAKGEELPAKERKGMFWSVDYNGKEAYVSVMKVKRKSGDKSMAKVIRAAATEGREENVTEARARSAVMGIRGLDENDETAGAGSVRPNLRMVFQMEDRQLSAAKIAALENRVLAEIEYRAERAERK